MSQNRYKQKLKEIHEKLKKWCDDNGDDELNNLLDELEAAFDAGSDEDDGSNPPGGPGTPP